MSRILNLPISLCIFVMVFVQFSEELSLEEFLSLNQNEKEKLDVFRQLVIPHLPHDYMKKDVYLIRWLRDSKFDIAAAQERLLNNIKWREENDIDTILEEDWDEFDNEFKQYMEGCSKDGKPIISTQIGSWDVRKFVIAGRAKQLMRFQNKMFEETEVLIRRMQEDGQNVTQTIFIFDLNNFNLVQQACGGCLAVYFHIIRTFSQNYPGGIHKSFLINLPQLAIPIWEIVRTALEPKDRDIISIFGKDKLSWSTELLKEINKNQLSVLYGGSNAEPMDYEDVRAAGGVYRCKNNT